ncbi:hypothetical protein [Nocardioides antri]|uniref:DUF4166 domain-containing protein n=1 Tax=Nocardioides antri TaxID=2607659 RepID=A0A5B1LYP9_9ACTN|nr:hypothetical protein [Nocardioides antri]KAA1425666.1 hypothetical protein F0U47_17940 [Nocardioides antri]
MRHVLDLGSRKFWRFTGREADLDGRERWLQAPMSGSPRVTDEWVQAEAVRHGGVPVRADAHAGLLPSMAMLDGPGFDAGRLRPEIRDFYEHTAAWQMEAWTGWSPLFWPAGELVARLFGRRVEQLALPMRPLDVAHGMDSEVTLIRDRHGAQVAAAWVRTLRGSGRRVFSGSYSARTLPGASRPSVHVAFPLESGNVQVFLRPTVDDDGALVLESSPGRFGQDGAYVVVRDRRDYAARAPLHERFRVYLDQHGVLRTDHELRLWNAPAVRLHYKLERAS